MADDQTTNRSDQSKESSNGEGLLSIVYADWKATYGVRSALVVVAFIGLAIALWQGKSMFFSGNDGAKGGQNATSEDGNAVNTGDKSPVTIDQSKNDSSTHQKADSNSGTIIQQGANSKLEYNEAPKIPENATVQIFGPDGNLIDGDFKLLYQRPGEGAAAAVGHDGLLPIFGLPPESAELLVYHVDHPKFELEGHKPGTTIAFPITSARTVDISVVPRYVSLGEPQPEEVAMKLEEAGFTKDQVLEKAANYDQKSDWVLTIENRAGKPFVIWIYDCWWCYNPIPKLSSQTRFTDLRVERNMPTLPFKSFQKQKTTSGIYAVYVEHNRFGRSHREWVGIFNFSDEKNRTLYVGNKSGNLLEVSTVEK